MEDIDTMLTKYLEEDYTSCSGQVGIVRWYVLAYSLAVQRNLYKEVGRQKFQGGALVKILIGCSCHFFGFEIYENVIFFLV